MVERDEILKEAEEAAREAWFSTVYNAGFMEGIRYAEEAQAASKLPEDIKYSDYGLSDLPYGDGGLIDDVCRCARCQYQAKEGLPPMQEQKPYGE